VPGEEQPAHEQQQRDQAESWPIADPHNREDQRYEGASRGNDDACDDQLIALTSLHALSIGRGSGRS
jgi:hypothetical protein